MPDFSNFNPAGVDDFFDAFTGELTSVAGEWWTTNKSAVGGYVRSLAEASAQTQIALAEGRISANVADQALRMQQATFRQTIRYTELMQYALAQKVVDTLFSMVGWAVFNKTGVNLFPELVKPED